MRTSLKKKIKPRKKENLYMVHIYGNGLEFLKCLQKSLNSVKILEKFLISLVGLEKSLKFTTLSQNIFLHG